MQAMFSQEKGNSKRKELESTSYYPSQRGIINILEYILFRLLCKYMHEFKIYMCSLSLSTHIFPKQNHITYKILPIGTMNIFLTSIYISNNVFNICIAFII